MEIEKLKLEHYKLELIKEGKILDPSAVTQGDTEGSSSSHFDISSCLR